MSRTDEHRAADEALTAAIEHCARVYGVLEEAEMTQEYVVLVATQKWDAEADMTSSAYSMLMRDGRVPSSRIVGLLEVASFDIKMGRDE